MAEVNAWPRFYILQNQVDELLGLWKISLILLFDPKNTKLLIATD